ncbi:MAG: lipoyl(octanoyl) transferase LipB [Candidatus Pristimantibacillus lignocellulolyticus]|uniref:Octanoyltransferase n=1 Tax=Candidatus Pristimantibacillus lignocellulolyticus TaxID=2994561 RepID=A0A9J6ZDE0_9BACL|nr:MAG: lipoyl(octanoyl) transferase LipB [Candidatus Pristimantibacillus lignocellulolyticus]
MSEAAKNTVSKMLDAHYIGMLDYKEAWDLQKAYVKEIDKGERPETLLLLQHPPTYTLGSDRHPEHLLLDKDTLIQRGISVYDIDRGGDITYHGPGQLVGYPLLYLDAIGLDLHEYLRTVEQVVIDWLAQYGIKGGRKSDYTGVWIGDEKITAIGVKFNKARQRRGFITSHGFALNIKSGIAAEGFSGIVPCGIGQFGVTSFNDITGGSMTVEEAAAQIVPLFKQRFGFA